MELSEKYAAKVAELKSFSAAAKALFVSQPALSATVARLEGELGFKIFDRSTSPLCLTAEGRIYIEYLGELSEREAEMKRRVRNLTSSASLAVGGSCYTAYSLLARLSGEVKRLCPGINLSVDMGGEASFGNLLEKVRRGTLDMMIGYYPDDKDFNAIPLMEEQLAVAMREELVPPAAVPYTVTRSELISGNYPSSKRFSGTEIFDGVEFIRLGRHTLTERIMNEVLAGVKYSSLNVENTHHTAMHYNLMLEGLGAVLIADTHVSSPAISDPSVRYFVPEHPNAKRTLYLISRKSVEPSSAAELFGSTAIAVCRELRAEHRAK
jgi:DNA-binding transcriptional LysR family regulator